MSTSLFTKQFWIASLTLLLGLFVPLMFREYVSVRNEGIHDAEWHTTSMAQLLRIDLSHHHPIYEVINHLNDPGHFEEIDLHIKEKIGSLGLILFKIYDEDGKVIYSNNHDLIGKTYQGNDLLGQTLKKGIESEIISREQLESNYGVKSDIDVVEVNMLINNKTGSGPSYILGFYYDYSPIQKRVNNLLFTKLGSLFLIFVTVTIVLFVLFRNKQMLENKVEILESILPICSHCKNIRVENPGQPVSWLPVESFFSRNQNLMFTHGICNDCMDEHYPSVQKK